MKPRVKIILIILLVILLMMLITRLSSAQTKEIVHNNDLWFTVHGDHRINDKWGMDLELHYRTANWGAEKQQLLIRPSLYYLLNDKVSIYAGYTHIETYPYGEQAITFQTPENNLWLQAVLKHKIGKIKFSHRYRFESRWTGNMSSTNCTENIENYTHRNRFRYRLTLHYSIPNSKFSLKVFDEMWVNYGENTGINVFDQNWLYAGIGYRLSDQIGLGSGYLLQSINKPDGIKKEQNNTIQLTLNYNSKLKTDTK